VNTHINTVSFTILLALFFIVTLTGFAAARWRRAENHLQLNEWGLGGRSFGSFISWFLLGGDLFTAYTFIAVPAVVFGTGSAGFFAVSYTIMVYPVAIIFLPRLWSVCRVNNYVTPADFIRGRYGSRGLALAMACTGILALLPYIALQLVGIQAVLTVMGVGNTTNGFLKDLPLLIAFVVLAVFTYVSGLRAPALIAFVKDTLVYLFIIVAVLYIPTKIGGWSHIFGASAHHFATTLNPKTGKPLYAFIPTATQSQLTFATLSFGSALALFIYPHTITGALAARRRDVIKRNMSLLSVYSIMLAFIALLGYMALATPTVAKAVTGAKNAQLAVPFLIKEMFPSWFAGVAFAAIVIGALVPAAIMSIAAANLFTRNIFKEFFKPDASPALETKVSQTASLLVKAGALAFALELSKQFSINLQLLGGVWVLQIFPTMVGGLFTRWFHRWALLVGWAAGMIYGTIAAYNVSNATTSHWAASTDIVFGQHLYIGFTALVINLVISVVLTPVCRVMKLPEGTDETLPRQYTADPPEAPVTPAVVAAAAGAEVNEADISGTGTASS
jgi:SSS family solute:Na+ symporter